VSGWRASFRAGRGGGSGRADPLAGLSDS
jgi:hypothetical protein